MTNAEKKYADIINMPHHTSPTRPRMSEADRAAQFSPFAALTGYDATVAEAGRLTDSELCLTEDAKTVLNEKMQMILDRLSDRPAVAFTYFVPDSRKGGGAYVTKVGVVKEISALSRAVVLEDKTSISIDSILEIGGEIFGG